MSSPPIENCLATVMVPRCVKRKKQETNNLREITRSRAHSERSCTSQTFLLALAVYEWTVRRSLTWPQYIENHCEIKQAAGKQKKCAEQVLGYCIKESSLVTMPCVFLYLKFRERCSLKLAKCKSLSILIVTMCSRHFRVCTYSSRNSHLPGINNAK